MNRRHLLSAGAIAVAAFSAAGVASPSWAASQSPSPSPSPSTSANPAPSASAHAHHGMAESAPTALPSESVYQLSTPLTDQTGRAFALGDGRGTPTIVSMFYTSCQYTCPMLVESIRATQQKLAEGERQHVNVLMVSFDPQHDTVAVLQKTAKERQIEDPRWTLARAEAGQVRKLASVLGVQYKALPNGDFNHTTALILLDAEGRVVGRTTQLGGADPAFVKLVKTTVAAAPH